MPKVKHIGASPLTGKIYQGTLDTDKHCWVGQKRDVTDQVCAAFAEHINVVKKDMAFGLAAGGFLVIRQEVVSELPPEFNGGDA